MGTVSYTGFSSCTRCTVRGVISDNRRIFVDLESPARTCKDFVEWRDGDFRRRATPLINITGLDFASLHSRLSTSTMSWCNAYNDIEYVVQRTNSS